MPSWKPCVQRLSQKANAWCRTPKPPRNASPHMGQRVPWIYFSCVQKTAFLCVWCVDVWIVLNLGSQERHELQGVKIVLDIHEGIDRATLMRKCIQHAISFVILSFWTFCTSPHCTALLQFITHLLNEPACACMHACMHLCVRVCVGGG